MTIRRGEIWWADLGEPAGSEPSLRRPVLVVQDNQYNRSRMATVIVLSITSNTRLADMPGNILIGREESGLPKESVINVSQITTIDRSWLENKVGSVSHTLMEEVDYGLGMVLRLNGSGCGRNSAELSGKINILSEQREILTPGSVGTEKAI